MDDICIEVQSGEIVAIIGANGAGKSSLLHAIIGLVPKGAGSIMHVGDDITALSAEYVVQRGISLVPETREVFVRMNCLDNLRMGAFFCRDPRLVRDRLESVFSLFPKLKDRQRQIAGTLSGGEQQMLAIGRALMQDPTLLLLDEPSLGLSPNMTEELFDRIRDVRSLGRTILLVEQKAHLALETADRGYLLTVGRITRAGAAAELKEDPLVKKVYFGE